jgi:adenine/guanine phosphoribosyltransferase-like PRPP-binding protein
MKNKLTTSGLATIWNNVLLSPKNLQIDIDISNYRFITCEALIGLCALIEYCLNNFDKECHVIMPELGMHGDRKYKIISNYISVDNNTLQYKLKEGGVRNIPFNLNDSRNIVRFISFLYHMEFMNMDIWRNQVRFINFERSLADGFFLYGGQRPSPVGSPDEAYRRYTNIHALHGTPEQRTHTLLGVLKSLMERAPETHINSPLFVDDELKEVFLQQLAENVASHAETTGFVMARTFSREDLMRDDVANRVLPSWTHNFRNQCRRHGFFEIVIADSGPGIYQTLKEAYSLVLRDVLRLPKSKIEHDVNNTAQVIEFALDEFGSAYLQADDQFRALVNRHTLNQVFQYTRKYGGILQLISDGICLSFDTSGKIERGKYGLGFKSKKEKGTWPEIGLHVSIILPHTPKNIQEYPKGRENLWVLGYPLERTLINFRNIGNELKGPPNDEAISAKAAEITRWALEKKIDQLTLDFSHTGNWRIDSFILFLSKIENLISFIHCWGINVPDIHITTLKTRWADGRAIPIPQERFLAFPCLDKERRLHLVSKDLLLLSEGLDVMFKGEIDREKKEYYPPHPISISDLFWHLRSKSRSIVKDLDELKLAHILGNHPHLFTYDSRGNNWKTRFDYLSMLESLKKSLTTGFNEILVKTGTFYREEQEQREHIFELPSTGMRVKQYYWTYNLLQIGTFTEQIARSLKAAIDNSLFPDIEEEERCRKIDAFLCATAPASLLAEAIAKLYQPSPPGVFDLGAVNELDPEDIKGSFIKDNIKHCIVVTDVVYTKTLINNLLKIATDGGAEVLAIAAIIRFDEVATEPSWFGDVMEVDLSLGKETRSYPLALISNYPRPEYFEGEIDHNKQVLYWIEPYSLMPFREERLINQYYAWEGRERHKDGRKDIPRRICLMDRKGFIRYGHFKNRNHHNRILIHMPQALQDEELADLIFEDILDFTRGEPPQAIIVPLHSSINYFIPHFNRRLRENSLDSEVICTIAVDLKGRGPWYLLPKEAMKILQEVHPEQKKIMFLDDAILTGRTVETFLRAVERFIYEKRKTQKNYKIHEIYIYCIINRVGRAASTKWRESQRFCDAIFKFREFIRFECPVYTRHDCPMCKEIKNLEEYRRAEGDSDDRIDAWVKRETEEREPLATVTRRHRLSTHAMLNNLIKRAYSVEDFLIIDSPKNNPKDPRFQNLDEFRLHSVDGALWWFWERSYRGSLPLFLLQKFKLFLDSEPNLYPNIKEQLLAEVLLWTLDNLPNLRLRDRPEATRVFLELIMALLQLGGPLIPRFLEKAGRVLTITKSDLTSLEILYQIFTISLEEINRHETMDAVSNINLGLYLIIIRSGINNILSETDQRFKKPIMEFASHEGKWQGFYQNLLLYLDPDARRGDFLYCLIFLLKLIYKRKHSLLFNFPEKMLARREIGTDSFGYLIDFLPEMLKALDIVIKTNIDLNPLVKQEYHQIKGYCNKVMGAFNRIDHKPSKEEMAGWVKYIETYICDESSAIKNCLDYYHPEILQVYKELENDISKSEPDFMENAIITINLDNNTELRIIGARLLLKDTLKNHIWDVLKDHKHTETRKININIIEEGEYTNIMIYNNWLKYDSAASLVKEGSTFNYLNTEWKKFGGELQYPKASNQEEYLSMLLLKVRRGFAKGGEKNAEN